MSAKELIFHTVQVTTKGWVLHTIPNHYVCRKYGPFFWVDDLAHHVFIGAGKNRQNYNNSLDHDKKWLQQIQKDLSNVNPELLVNHMSSHVSVIINPKNKILDGNQKYKVNENNNKWREPESLNKKRLYNSRVTSKSHKCGSKTINRWGLPKTECRKSNTGWGKTNNFKIDSVNKEKTPEYTR